MTQFSSNNKCVKKRKREQNSPNHFCDINACLKSVKPDHPKYRELLAVTLYVFVRSVFFLHVSENTKEYHYTYIGKQEVSLWIAMRFVFQTYVALPAQHRHCLSTLELPLGGFQEYIGKVGQNKGKFVQVDIKINSGGPQKKIPRFPEIAIKETPVTCPQLGCAPIKAFMG